MPSASATLKEVRLDRSMQPWARRLYLPAYQVSQAAQYVHAHPNTIARWHYAKNPLLPGRTRKQPLSYLELVEVAFVAFFRRLGVSHGKIRKARDYVAQNLSAEYPFAEYKFKTEGFHILMDFSQFMGERQFKKVVVADRSGQLAWEAMIGERFAEFDYDYELAMRWHPAGRESKVVIDPRISFGAPVVDGLATWVVGARYTAGEGPDEIADEFGISYKAVLDGLRFEGIATNGYDDAVLGQKRS